MNPRSRNRAVRPPSRDRRHSGGARQGVEPRARGWIVGVVAACVLAWLAADAFGQDREREYKIKAAYLYNFTKYVEWPAAAFSGPQTPFVIGVIGPDPVGAYLREIARFRQVGDRRLEVKHFPDVNQIEPCPVVFLSDRVLPADQQRIVAELGVLPALTVGESNDFSAWGGAIRFKVAGDRVNLVISKSAYQRSGLAISSKLLQLDVVEIVK